MAAIAKKARRKRTSRRGSVTQAELARLFAVDVRTVQRWRRDGMPVEGKSGRTVLYNPAKAIAWRRQRDREEAERAARPSTFEEARTAKMIAEAQLVQLKLGLQLRRLMTVEAFCDAISGAFARVRTILLTLPRRAAPDLLGLKTLAEITAVLERHLEDVLRELYDAADVPGSDDEIAA